MEEGNETAEGGFAEGVGVIIFHPKVVGLIFILLIAIFTIRLVAS